MLTDAADRHAGADRTPARGERSESEQRDETSTSTNRWLVHRATVTPSLGEHHGSFATLR
jgi:hypothetical protein